MEQRRFVLRHLRDYGFARRFDPLEEEMNSEIGQYIDTLKNGPKYPHEKVNNFAAFVLFLFDHIIFYVHYPPAEIHKRWPNSIASWIRFRIWKLFFQGYAQRTPDTRTKRTTF